MKQFFTLTQITLITFIALSFSFSFSCLTGCGSGSGANLDADSVALNNQGVAYMGQFNFEKARTIFAGLLKKYPNHPDLLTNLAIATLNRQAEGDERVALTMLAEVLKQKKNHLRARYCTGLLELHQGKPTEALVHLRQVSKSDPGDAAVLYFIGKTLLQMSKYEEALVYFKRSIDLDSYIHSSYYGMIMALRQLRRTDEAYKMIAEFQRLKQNPRARLVEFKYTKMGKKAEAMVMNENKPKKIVKPAGHLFADAAVIPGLQNSIEKFQSQNEGKGESNPGITVCDINNDGVNDIFISSALHLGESTGNAVLIAASSGNSYSQDPAHPLALVKKVNAALWGDLNDDGITDVYLCRKGNNQLWLQGVDGQWRDATAESKTGNNNLDTVDGVLLDADHDGDLDIFLVNGNGHNELFNNNRDGTFRPLAKDYGLTGDGSGSKSVVICDLDLDRDADIIVINKKPPHNVYINERLWKYSQAKNFDALISGDIQAMVAGDVDADGKPELYCLDSKGTVHSWLRQESGTWLGQVLKNSNIRTTSPGQSSGLALTDVEGDGVLDLLVYGGSGWQVFSFTGTGSDAPGIKQLFARDIGKKLGALALINTLQGPGVLVYIDGAVPQLYGPGKGRYGFAQLHLKGKSDNNSNWRSNASGIGMQLAARVGSQWTVLNTFRSHSGPGHGLQPVLIGLAGKQAIDFVAINWSDGVFQSEMNLAAGKKHLLNETQRQMSSCPVIFAWNGEKYEFVSDFLGVGGIGYSVAPGEYSEPRPWENFMFPQGLLKPQDGRIKIKLTEPMEEAAYLDAVRLRLYELPPGWFMTLDERMGILEPVPTGEPRFYRTFILPVQAMGVGNKDVTESVLKRDLKAAPPGELDYRFIGMLKNDHVLTVTFDRALDSFRGEAMLVADGWVEYPYSQTNFAASQAGATYRAPTIEALTVDGKWVTVLEQFGYPAGMPRQMSVPLKNLPKEVKTIRISTNQEVYWDRLLIAFAEPCPKAKNTLLKLETAYLEQNGFPQRLHLPQRLPYYDYNKRKPYWDTYFLEGDYTRFGVMDELIRAKDNALVIFGPGEGVHMEFLAPDPISKNGWTGIYVIETDGWCKDMDLYTNTGDTVAPIPFQGKRSKEVELLHKKYNIRWRSASPH